MRDTAKTRRTFGRTPDGSKRAFTLIELLVVLALTAILMTVIFKPLVDSQNLALRASSQIESQAAARNVMAEVSTTLSLAEYVQDTVASPLNLWIPDQNGNQFVISSQSTMLEYVPPAHQLDQNSSYGGTALPIDPTTGKPTTANTGLASGYTGLAFPLTNGITLGRLFIGLRNNISGPGVTVDGNTYNGTPVLLNPTVLNRGYGNSFEDPKLVPANQNNTYTLYKAEVNTFIPDPTMATTNYVPNLRLFHTNSDLMTGQLMLHDPNFFYDNSYAGGKEATAGSTIWAVPGWKDLNGDGKVEIWENWRAVSSSLVRLDKVDMVDLARDPVTNAVLYNVPPPSGTVMRPTVTPLATFKPAFVQNDPAVATDLENSGNEVPNPISPTFLSQYNHWAYNYRVIVYRSDGTNTDPTQRNPLDYYEGVSNASGVFKIVHIGPAMNLSPGTTPPDPNTLPDISPQFMNGIFTNPNAVFGFQVDMDKGKVMFDYASTAIVHDTTAPFGPEAMRYRPDVINNAAPGSRRYLDLTGMLDSTAYGSPAFQLNPAVLSPLAPALAGNTLQTPTITPGSELVFGPDQRPGIHYGQRIQYTRVPVDSQIESVGPNQYFMMYTDAPNGFLGTSPSLKAGYVQFDSQPDGTQYNAGTLSVNGGNDPATGRPAAGPHMLPIFKFNKNTGMVDPNMPADPVEIYFRFQMNQPQDVVKIDYLTRELMIFSLEMRMYDPASGRPQTTRLTDKIKVRNLQH